MLLGNIWAMGGSRCCDPKKGRIKELKKKKKKEKEFVILPTVGTAGWEHLKTQRFGQKHKLQQAQCKTTQQKC